MNAGKVVLILFGGVVLLFSLGLVIAGGLALGIERAFTDESGFFAVRSTYLARDAAAIVLSAPIAGHGPRRSAVILRVSVTATDPGKSLFVGIGARRDVEDYLAGAGYDEITGYESPHRRLTWRVHAGTAAPQPSAAAQGVWRVSASGAGTQTLAWRLEPGEWSLVLMNADGSKGIRVAGSIGARAPWLFGVGLAVLLAGIALLAVGIVLIALATRRPETAAAQPASAAPAAPGAFPLVLGGEKTEPLSPWLWLVKWFLLIPHFFVLGLLWFGAAAVWVIALFAILFTGRYPKRLFDFTVGVLRWTWRVGFYGCQALGTDRYPPFTLRAGGYPADLDVAYPGALSRGRALVKWWLLAIPHYIVLACLQGGVGVHYGGLVLILAIFGMVSVLFTGHYPNDLFALVLGINRWSYRVLAYVGLLTDQYPPFRLDQ
ncbi:MAG: DUF4389 domain-containing protein [Candidatus Bipolaricaulota bacterium]|jgi:hypothetical protein|nr:DUF4389 domain-containing protein [Candidatus Bipolaricaulota bacterium]